MVSQYLTADSAHYVRICMREALHCCYVIALAIFILVYIVVSQRIGLLGVLLLCSMKARPTPNVCCMTSNPHAQSCTVCCTALSVTSRPQIHHRADGPFPGVIYLRAGHSAKELCSPEMEVGKQAMGW